MLSIAVYSVVNSKRECQDDLPPGDDVIYPETKLPDSLCPQNVSHDGKAETEWTQKTSYSRYRLFSLGLGLLFLLLFIIIIFLSVRLHRGNETWSVMEDNLKQLRTNCSILAKENEKIQDQLQEHYSFLAKEKEELQDNCNNDKDQLQEENKMMANDKDQLQKEYNNLTNINNLLQNKYNTLANSKDLLQNDYNILLNKLPFLKHYCKQGEACTPCPEGWKIFNDKCYYQYPIKKKWEESKTYCSEHGGNLAVIESQEEQEFIKTFIKDGNSWIGLTDRKREGSWLWVNGAELKESFWEIGEPDNRPGPWIPRRAADCVHFQAKDGVWFDDDCDKQLNSLCETEALSLFIT